MLQSNETITTPQINNSYVRQICIIGAFFFIFGFITWVNGTLIPYLRIACELEEWQAYLVTFAFYISYTVMAIPSSKLLERTGMITGMRIGLVVMAVGCSLFIPAALLRFYPLFLLGLFVGGAGMTLLQTAVNPYITLLGPANKAAQRISIMGICNKLAGVLAPLILGAIILNNSGDLIKELAAYSPDEKVARLDELARMVIMPYTALTAILLIIAYCIKFAHLPEIKPPSVEVEDGSATAPVKSGNTDLLLGFIAIFCVVGLEVLAGDTIGNYGLYHGLNLDVAKSLTSFTLACTVIGYLFGAFAIPRMVSQEKAYLYSSSLGMVISLAVLFVPGIGSVACVALLGMSNALLWPAIWPQALKGLHGARLNRGAAILIMGIAGGAILPLVYGWLARSTNNQVAYLLLIPCYLFNLYYGMRGRRATA
ncbi:sugar MFS transporter [Mucilaginibacter daejeonensis]|uniref:sugar MFS transporter n=1 Tax=Mucilaginibacter daejeonensis TaxID=398049 RepID=UPI001D17A297|nr:sugar MFS transporter [Mucilaginibacter daejeonensis]UEG54978.1 sugar MFS transporter [Mucilaginibacter daejeonensis]